jgi:hypothetical protein
MLRSRLLIVAALAATALPGCGLFCGDRPGVFERMRRDEGCGGPAYGMPVSFPGGDAGCGGCGGTVIPPGATVMPGNGPMIMPGNGGGLGSETLPPPYAGGDGSPRIPKAGIKETPGKQFELEKGTKGPVLTIPAVRGE